MQAILNKASKYIKELNALTLNEYNPIEVFYRMTRENELAHSEICI